MPTIVVLDPVAEARPAATPRRERPSTLAGKRTGFLNNTKANASELLADPSQTFRVPLCSRAEDIHVFVAGGAGRHSLFIPTFGSTVAVTREIRL